MKDSQENRNASGVAFEPLVRQSRHTPCAGPCEFQAYEIEIRRLKGVMIRSAAELARLLHHDDTTPSLDKALYAVIQRLKSSSLDGA